MRGTSTMNITPNGGELILFFKTQYNKFSFSKNEITFSF